MEHMFNSASFSNNHVAVTLPERVFASGLAVPLPLQVVSAGFRVPPVETEINMLDSSFPTGTFEADIFCGVVLGRPTLRDILIVRIDWLQKDSWPLYHQYLLVEVLHSNRVYELRIETLGKVDRSRMVIQALGLNSLHPGNIGTAKFQIQVLEVTNDSLAGIIEDHDPPANLLASITSIDHPLFRYLQSISSDCDDWYFTSVTSPNLSVVDGREPPTLGHLCRVLSSITRRAPDYSIEAQNCYFLCRMTMLGVSELCAPLPRLTWTLHALYKPHDFDTKVSWYLRVRGPTLRFLTASSSILNVEGCPSDHLRMIIVNGWGLCGVSSFYQGISFDSTLVLLLTLTFLPLIICGALQGRRKLWIGCTAALCASFVIIIIARYIGDCRWRRTLDRLEETEGLILRDLGLPTRTVRFSPQNGLIGFPPNISMGVSHAVLPRAARRLLERDNRERFWARSILHWTIAGDEWLLRCLRAVCRMPEPW